MEVEIDIDEIVSILQRLVTLGRERREEGVSLLTVDGSVGPSGDVSALELQSIGGVSNNIAAELWGRTAQEGVSMADVARGLRLLILRCGTYGLTAALAYSRLLSLEGCQVLSMFDCITSTTMLKAVRDTCIPPAAPTPADAMDDEDMDVDGGGTASEAREQGLQQCNMIIQNLGEVLGRLGLKDQPDTLKAVAETLAVILSSTTTPGPTAVAASAALLQLLQPGHGSVKDTAALILRHLTAALLNQAPAGGGAPKDAITTAIGDVRTRVLAFALTVSRNSSEAQEAVLALARHVVLKAPDKADARSLAASAAVELLREMPLPHQHDFVVFVARLSRTPKVYQRHLAVDLASTLVDTLPDPFSPASVIQPTFRMPATAAKEGTVTVAATPGVTALTAHSGVTASPQSTAVIHTGTVTDARRAPGELPPNCFPAPWGTVCLAIMVHRSSDKAAAVRGKALASLAGVITAWVDGNQAPLRQAEFRQALALANLVRMPHQLSGTPGIISPPFISPAGVDEPAASPLVEGASSPVPLTGNTVSGAPFVQQKLAGCMHRHALRNAAARAGAFQLDDLDLEHLATLARRRARDEKAGVRKAGIQLLEALLLMRGRGFGGIPPEEPSGTDIQAVEVATADPLVSVRKTGLSAASNLLMAFPDSVSVALLWVEAALPMVRDVEVSLQEGLVDQFYSLVIARAATAGAPFARGDTLPPSAQQAADGLRPILAALSICGAAGATCVNRACAALHVKRRLKGRPVATGLQRIISDTGSDPATIRGAWLLLAEVSAQEATAPCWQFLMATWRALKDPQPGRAGLSGEDGTLLLRVIANAAASFPPADAAHLAQELLQAVLSFSLPPAAAAAHVAALSQLTPSQTLANPEEAGAPAQTQTLWASAILAAGERALAAYVENCGASFDAADDNSAQMQQAGLVPTALFTLGEVALVRAAKPSSRVVVLVQALTSARLASNAPNSRGHAVPLPIQAHAWVALGKLCLTDEALAKKCVPLLVQELGCSSSPVVRNNIMVALADLCVQWTALVDAHVPRLAACLSDNNEIVRRQALALLANLLSKDYVKWRGALFQRFLLALVDDSKQVKALAQFLLADTLASKAPLLAYNHFVESLFALNGCRPGTCAALSGALDGTESLSQESVAVPLGPAVQGTSPSARGKREAIYQALLRRLAPEHKFATAAKLCGEVLAGFAEGALPLGEASEVLRDALHILASKDIRVTVGRVGGTEEEEAAAPAAVAGAAKGRLVSAMMKKHLVEGMIPVLVELKRLLEAERHPLLGQLFITLRALLKEHRAEIEDILVADKQLAAEILHDIKQAEQAERLQAAAAAANPAAPAGGTPRSPAPDRGGGARTAHKAGPSRFAGTAARPAPGGDPPGTLPGTPRARDVLLSMGAPKSSRRRASCPTPASAARPRVATPTTLMRTTTMATPGHPLTAARAERPLSPGGAAAFATPEPSGRAPQAAGTCRRTPLTAVHLEGGQHPDTPGACPISVPRICPGSLRRVNSAAVPEAAAQRSEGGKENEGEKANSAADIVLPSPFKAASGPQQWRIEPDTSHAANSDGPPHGPAHGPAAAAAPGTVPVPLPADKAAGVLRPSRLGRKRRLGGD